MTAPSQGLPTQLKVHVLDAQGNELPPEQIPSTAVGGKGKTNLTFLRFELWSFMVDNTYWNGEIHLFLRIA